MSIPWINKPTDREKKQGVTAVDKTFKQSFWMLMLALALGILINYALDFLGWW